MVSPGGLGGWRSATRRSFDVSKRPTRAKEVKDVMGLNRKPGWGTRLWIFQRCRDAGRATGGRRSVDVRKRPTRPTEAGMGHPPVDFSEMSGRGAGHPSVGCDKPKAKAPHLPTEGRYGPRDMWATSQKKGEPGAPGERPFTARWLFELNPVVRYSANFLAFGITRQR